MSGRTLMASHHGVSLLVARGRGLVVEVTDGVGDDYRGSLYGDLAKTCTPSTGIVDGLICEGPASRPWR